MADQAKNADSAGPMNSSRLDALVARAGVCLVVMFVTLFGLFGVLFALWGLTIGGAPLSTLNFSLGSLSTEGTVVKVQDAGEGHWTPVVEYHVDGKNYTLSGWAGSQQRSRWTVGQKVPVLYLQEEPGVAQIDLLFDRWFYPSFLMAGGLLFVVGSAGILWSMYRTRKQERGGRESAARS